MRISLFLLIFISSSVFSDDLSFTELRRLANGYVITTGKYFSGYDSISEEAKDNYRAFESYIDSVRRSNLQNSSFGHISTCLNNSNITDMSWAVARFLEVVPRNKNALAREETEKLVVHYCEKVFVGE